MQGAENGQSSWTRHGALCPWRALLRLPSCGGTGWDGAPPPLATTSSGGKPDLLSSMRPPRLGKHCRVWSWLAMMITSHVLFSHPCYWFISSASSTGPAPQVLFLHLHLFGLPETCDPILCILPVIQQQEVSGGFSGGFRMMKVEWDSCRKAGRKGASENSGLWPKRRGKHSKSCLLSRWKRTVWNGNIFVLLPACEFCKMWGLPSERCSVSFKIPFQWAQPPGLCPQWNCVSMHAQFPSINQKSFLLTNSQSLTQTYGNIWFCMQIFTK